MVDAPERQDPVQARVRERRDQNPSFTALAEVLTMAGRAWSEMPISSTFTFMPVDLITSGVTSADGMIRTSFHSAQTSG